MNQTITPVFVSLMLAEYKRYEEIKKLSPECLTEEQREVLLKSAINSFRDLATIYLKDYLDIGLDGSFFMEDALYNYTEPDTNADIYDNLTVWIGMGGITEPRQDYVELLALFNLNEAFYQSKDHSNEWCILTSYLDTENNDEDGCESFTGTVRDDFNGEEATLMEIILVTHIEAEVLKNANK